ncbi:MAG: hypothetical protein M3Z18_01460, partial [Gemmatimonadota bacterium]|nr:hypothetical protein [Gemmatimonadota bacterium]
MYRPLVVSVIFLALACKGGTKSASAAAASSGTPDQNAQKVAAANQPSNTAGDLAGPISTTQGSGASSASPQAGTPNPNRVPNEMG